MAFSIEDLKARHKPVPDKFEHRLFDLPDIQNKDMPFGRFYGTPEGIYYPSVTTFLSSTKDDSGLKAWRERVGEDEANRIMQEAQVRGTAVHLACENFVSNNPNPQQYAERWDAMFRQLAGVLKSNVTCVRGIEIALWSHKLQLAGRSDLVCEWNGDLCIADYKNFSRPKPDDMIDDYWLQLYAYSAMLYELTGEKAKKLVLLCAIENGMGPVIKVRWTDEFKVPFAERFMQYRNTDYYKNTASRIAERCKQK